jgi:pantothenate synthetase
MKKFLIKELKKDDILNIEYLEIRSEDRLIKLKKINKKRARIFIAVIIGKVRLIDNIKITQQ